MKKYFFILLSFLMVACSTLEVHTDYDEGYDFTKINSFAVLHNKKEGESTLVNDRITYAIEHLLQTKGYQLTSLKNADILVVYHYNTKDKMEIQTDYQMIGIRPYGFGGGMIATTSTYEYTEGIIIIDFLDTKTKKIIYRSVGRLELQEQETPQERKAYVLKIIQEVLKEFPMRGKTPQV
jgi:hypothetical protein